MKIKFTISGEIQFIPDGSEDAIIRHLTTKLARSDQSLADAVAAAGSTNSSHGDTSMATPAKPKVKVGDPTGNPTLDALIAQVTTDQTVIGSATTLINGIAAQITAAVNVALAGGATAAQLAPLTDLTTSLAASDASLAAAVAANTPTPPAPPSPPTP